jgi:type IV secretory pathway ATPase VirB11/archaellum biosynthesis ATPase
MTHPRADTTDTNLCAVPAPLPPDNPEAWYAPQVRSQREVTPGVVVTIVDRTDGVGFTYQIREPSLDADAEDALTKIHAYFAGANLESGRPLTREGTAERATQGLTSKYQRVIGRLLDQSLTGGRRRRIAYYVLRDFQLLGSVTPVALDDQIEIVDLDDGIDDVLVVHTKDYAPAVTSLSASVPFAARVASERLKSYVVTFAGFDVDVVIHRDHLLGDDRFYAKYAVVEPALLPGDETLIRECKKHIWGANVDELVADRTAFVQNTARKFLSRRLTVKNTQTWIAKTAYRSRQVLARVGVAAPPVGRRYAKGRLDDLIYYILRDLIGEGVLTIPIRDSHLEDIEANRVDAGERVPTNLSFENETTFVNVVTQLAAADGVELSSSRPSAKVNLEPDGIDATAHEHSETIRCAVALPVISESGPHISIRKQAAKPLTPVDLIHSGSIPTELVALLWLLYEHHRVVLFSGPTGAGKTTLLNSLMPFIPYDHRPISIDEGSREVYLPHETGVSLTTREHEDEFKRVSMADLMTEANYLNPDIEVIAEVNTPASFQTYAEILNTGHGVIGTTHAEDIHTLVNRVVEQGLPVYLLRELDLVVFPRRVNGERYVGSVVELLSAADYETLPSSARTGVIEKAGTTLYYNTILWRDTDGSFAMAYDHPSLGGPNAATEGIQDRLTHRVFHRIATATDQDVDDIAESFRNRHRYVQYLVREDITDADRLFGFLADLRTDEAATIERVRRRQAAPDDARPQENINQNIITEEQPNQEETKDNDQRTTERTIKTSTSSESIDAEREA